MKKSTVFLNGLAAVLFILVLPVVSMAQSQTQPQPQPQLSTDTQAKPQAAKGVQGKPQAWTIYMESENNKYYFDPASIQYPGKRVVRVWERMTVKGIGDKETEKVKSLIELDCNQSSYRIIAWKEYDPETQMEKPEVRSDNEPWSYFTQDTILGILYDNVCYKSTIKKTDQKPKTDEKKKGK